MQKLSKTIATLFFVGYSPFASGTVASILALPLYIFVSNKPLIYISLTLFLLIIGFWVSSHAEKDFPKKDPKEIVIDEFSSMLLVFIFIPFMNTLVRIKWTFDYSCSE